MSAYLDLLEGVLRTGLAQMGQLLKDAQVRFVLSQQCPDGGFTGRRGGADVYYTDFALRLLALVAPETPSLAATAVWLATAPPPTDVIQAFNLLNTRRLLAQCGHEVFLDTATITESLRHQRLPGGGFARPGQSIPSAYHTFLAALCSQMLGEPLPQAEGAWAAIARLQGPSGGFREQLSEGIEQTNATAAAVAFLLLEERLTEPQALRAAAFLGKLQAEDGGFLAHGTAPCGDLLSTFTALATLAGLDGFERVDLSAVARFLRRTAAADGGFKAAPADTEPDIEYTYYGLGCLALIHAAL